MIRGLTPCEYVRRFMLVNLTFQIEAVRRYTEGWSRESVLAWLAIYGTVVYVERVDGYGFRSNICPGFPCHVWFDANSRIRSR